MFQWPQIFLRPSEWPISDESSFLFGIEVVIMLLSFVAVCACLFNPSKERPFCAGKVIEKIDLGQN